MRSKKGRTRNTLLHDFQATLLYLLGIDHERLKHQGRRYRLTAVSGEVVKRILA